MAMDMGQTPLHSGYSQRTTAQDVLAGVDLTGTNAIVTGGHAGMGLEITKALARAGASVSVPARNPQKAQQGLAGVPRVEIAQMDLMDPASIDAYAAQLVDSGRPLHLLINNAGLMTVPESRDSRGNISQFSTNNLGHFQLTARLWPALARAHGARVVSVSSRVHRISGFNFEDPNFEHRPYDKVLAYAESKSGVVLFTVELDRRGKEYGVRAFAVHPGLVPHSRLGGEGSLVRRMTTGLFRLLAGFSVKKIRDDNGKPVPDAAKSFFKSVSQGAATALWCATTEQLEGRGGLYCEDCDIAEAVPADSLSEKGVRPWAIDPEQARQYWETCELSTGVQFLADFPDPDKV